MKILFCTNVYQVTENGPVKFARYLLEINKLFPDHQLNILTEDLKYDEENLHALFIPQLFKRSIFSQFFRMWAYHRAAMKIKKKFHFDVLIYNHAIVGLMSCYLFSKTIVMINDDNYISFHYSKLMSIKEKIKKIIFRKIEKIISKKAYKTIVNSSYLKNEILKEYHCQVHKVSILHKGIDINIKPRIKSSCINVSYPIKILFVKNDFMRGGLIVLASALSTSNFKFNLVIAGTNVNSSSIITSIFYEIKNVTISILGKIPVETIYYELSKTDIFCVPSLKESFGVANLEAISIGVPVVSSNVGGIPEVLDYGQCGWMAKPGDYKDLAEQIDLCIKDNSLREIKVNNGLIHARKFSKLNMFYNFIDIVNG